MATAVAPPVIPAAPPVPAAGPPPAASDSPSDGRFFVSLLHKGSITVDHYVALVPVIGAANAEEAGRLAIESLPHHLHVRQGWEVDEVVDDG